MLLKTQEEVPRVHHQEQLLLQQVTDMNARVEQIADSDYSLKSEINRQMAIRERSKTPMSAMTMSLPRAGPTNRRGGEDGESSDRLDYKAKKENLEELKFFHFVRKNVYEKDCLGRNFRNLSIEFVE